MKRGEIYYANLSPGMGFDLNKRRPMLMVSHDLNNLKQISGKLCTESEVKEGYRLKH